MDTNYIVYKYTFPNGKVYIGRSRKDRKRFGNVEKYKGQYVYKKMLKYPNFEKTVLYSTDNLFSAF